MGDHSKDLTDEKKKKPLSLGTSVHSKKASGAQVRQSFSHGRSKSVTVEVKRRRSVAQQTQESPFVEPVEERATDSGAGRLTHEEQDARLRALKDAMQQAAEETSRVEKQSAELESQPPEEQPASAAPSIDQPSSLPEETPSIEPDHGEFIPASLQPDPSLGIKVIERKKPLTKPVAVQKERLESIDEDEDVAAQKRKQSRFDAKRLGSDAYKADTKRNYRQAAWQGEEEDTLAARRASARKKRKRQGGVQVPPAPKLIREVLIPDFIVVQELASRMSEKVGEVIKLLMNMGVMATQNQAIDGETAELVATELGHRVKRISDADIERDLIVEDSLETDLQPKAPVVTVMGHVDHGKTSLLDALRKTNQVATEAGGITQHIGAYQVELPSGKRITFIDTPGHAAFTQMRSRGAHVTDIVVLVVAADDSVKDQTVEAIHHAKAANVPIVVAINKIDKPDANPDRVRQMLLSHEVVLEHLGGDVLDVEVSAKTGLNLEKLEEAILLQAEILDLKANPDRLAEGVVIEAKVEKGRGPVATVLVQKGTLRIGDAFVAGAQWGRVRALTDHQGQTCAAAGPSVPIEVSGFSAPPSAGDLFIGIADETRARKVAAFRGEQAHQKKVAVSVPSQSWEELLAEKASGTTQSVAELAIVLKVDTQGSLEALKKSLEDITHEEVRVRLLHGAVGAITESDVVLAKASNALIIGFNVRANPQASDVAKKEGIKIRYYSVIYNVLDDVKAALSGLLSPTLKEQFLGNASIRQVFNVSKVGKIAGCMVTEGIVKRGAKVRLLRDHVVIHEGSLKTLKRLKDEVREAREGYECGMAFENYQDIREGDVIECFEIEEIQRTL